MDLGPHAMFIWAAYAATVAGLAAVGSWLILDGRRQQRLLDELDEHGMGRRSASAPGSNIGHRERS